MWCNGISYQGIHQILQCHSYPWLFKYDLNGVLQTSLGDAQWCQSQNIDYQFNICVGPPLVWIQYRIFDRYLFSCRSDIPILQCTLRNRRMPSRTWSCGLIIPSSQSSEALSPVSTWKVTQPDDIAGISIGGFLAMFDDYPELEPLIWSAPDAAYHSVLELNFITWVT